jgi:hypothetical protein
MVEKVDEVLAEIAAWRDGKLWGATAIAKFATVSEDTVYRWEKLPDCPISKPAGRYFTTKGELMAWLRNKPPAAEAVGG